MSASTTDRRHRRAVVCVVTAALAVLAGVSARAADAPAATARPAPDPVAGRGYFAVVCSSCHGLDASGLPQMGRDLRGNAFVQKSDLPTIVAFIQKGHAPTPQFPEGMPPDGSSSFTPAQLTDIAAWLKTLPGNGS